MTSAIPQMRRRDFLAVLGLSGASPTLKAVGMPLQGKDPSANLKCFNATCSMECLHCNLKGFVDSNGQLIKIEGANSFNGKPCGRGLSRVKWVYAQDRIKTPLRRIGEKGEGKFEPISWDEALDTIAGKLKEAIEKDGSKSILLTSASGNMDSLMNPTQVAFGNYLGGVTRTVGSLCCSAVTAAMIPIVGERYVDTRDTIPEAMTIICWGNNPIVTMQAYWHLYRDALNKGAKLIVIDPRKSETAVRAHEWIPIIPGTGAALALGMMRQIFKDSLIDSKFLKAHTGAPYLVKNDGSLALENSSDTLSFLVWDSKSDKAVRHDTPGIDPALRVKPDTGFKTALSAVEESASVWTPEKVQEITGIPAKTVIRLAKEYARGPSMIVNNMGSFQRTEFGPQAIAAQYYLALLTGNIGKGGTGVCDAGGATQMGKFAAPIPAPSTKVEKVTPIPTAKLGECVLTDTPTKINVWYSQTCGIIGQWPNTNKVVAAVKKVPFFVVADSVMTPTARYADIVLPATTVFEYDSVMAGTRNHYVQLIEKAVEPQGEAKPDYWIMSELAKRMGFGEAFNLTPEQMIRNVLKPSGISYEQIKAAPVKPIAGPWIPFKDGVFKTPNKKANFYIEAWIKKGFKPVASYYQVAESPRGNPELAAKYPLMAIQRKVIRNIHTSHHNNEWLKEIFPPAPTAWINSEDALRLNVRNGDMVEVFNDRGCAKAKALVSPDILKGVVSLPNGWWMDTDGFNSFSVLTNDTVEALGFGTSICSTLVNIRRA